jgi:hypothetical protein
MMAVMRRAVAVSMALALAWALPTPARAVEDCPSGVHRVPSANVGDLYENILTAVDAAGPGDVWAVGYTIGDGAVHLALAEHWDGSEWTAELLPSPSPGFNVLLDVAAAGPDDVWAVGERLSEDFLTSFPLIEHWDGESWSVVPAPEVEGSLNGVAAISADDVWAVGVGRGGDVETNLTLHWDGAAWSVVTAPRIGSRGNYLTAVAGTGPNDVWAVGFRFKNDTSSATTILHWDGATWRRVASPNGDMASSSLFGVAVDPNGKAWAVGDTGNRETGHPLILRWGGGAWKVARDPRVGAPSARLTDVAIRGPGDVWAVGSRFNGRRGLTLVERWDGERWTVVPAQSPSPDANELDGVAVEGDAVWMVGTFRRLDLNAYRTLVLRACP